MINIASLLEVTARRDTLRILGSLVFPPPPAIVESGLESLSNRPFDPGAGLRKARLAGTRPIALLRVLAESELDPRWRSFEEESRRTSAPTQLDHRVATADRVRRAMQDVGRSQPTGELPVEVQVIGVDDVFDRDLGGGDSAPLVAAAGDRGVAVGIDETGGQVTTDTVEDHRTGGDTQAGSDALDTSRANQEIGVVEDALSPRGPDRRATHQ